MKFLFRRLRFGLRSLSVAFVFVSAVVAFFTTPLFQGAHPSYRELDVAILGRGYFEVTDGETGQTFYTRCGRFHTNSDADLCVGDPADGWILEPRITVPQAHTAISISKTGLVSCRTSGQSAQIAVGHINLTTFANDASLTQVHPGVFAETDASGPPVSGLRPGSGGAGFLMQRWLESAGIRSIDWHLLMTIALLFLVGYQSLEVRRLRAAISSR